jgi:hypothetical protein
MTLARLRTGTYMSDAEGRVAGVVGIVISVEVRDAINLLCRRPCGNEQAREGQGMDPAPAEGAHVHFPTSVSSLFF